MCVCELAFASVAGVAWKQALLINKRSVITIYKSDVTRMSANEILDRLYIIPMAVGCTLCPQRTELARKMLRTTRNLAQIGEQELVYVR